MPLAIIVLIIIIAVVIRLAKDSPDRDRIRRYIGGLGGTADSITWLPWAPGSLVSRADRFYAVIYSDAQGATHRAVARTSGWSGVYLTEEQPPEGGAPTGSERSPTDLETENARLRLEVDRLKQVATRPDGSNS